MKKILTECILIILIIIITVVKLYTQTIIHDKEIVAITEMYKKENIINLKIQQELITVVSYSVDLNLQPNIQSNMNDEELIYFNSRLDSIKLHLNKAKKIKNNK
jgi:hypothetical protein